MMSNITKIRDAGLCISCGACVANCPKDCISYENKYGMYLPVISNSCIDCNKCLRVCPSYEMKQQQDLNAYCLGEYKGILCAKSKDAKVLKNATSGGIITTLILQLLKQGKYDCAFTVFGYDYHRLIKTEMIDRDTDISKSYGSRYLTVSQEDAIKYILENRDKRVIIVATSCCVSAILNTIKANNLTRENYLLIGLFCDKTMHYKLVDYFDAHEVNKGRRIAEFFFRSKVGSKWPGKLRMVYTDKSESILASSERKNLKEYFVPERCLYCLDKLNRGADISVGDNYIKANADEEGISSVIVRTESGLSAWNECGELFEQRDDDTNELLKSQLIDQKYENLAYGAIKGIYDVDITDEQRKKYTEIMRKRKVGISENTYRSVSKDIKKKQFKIKLKRKIKKMLGIK